MINSTTNAMFLFTFGVILLLLLDFMGSWVSFSLKRWVNFSIRAPLCALTQVEILRPNLVASKMYQIVPCVEKSCLLDFRFFCVTPIRLSLSPRVLPANSDRSLNTSWNSSHTGRRKKSTALLLTCNGYLTPTKNSLLQTNKTQWWNEYLFYQHW